MDNNWKLVPVEPTEEMPELPQEIIDAARLVEHYFKELNVRQWKLYGVQNREETRPTPPADAMPTERELTREEQAVFAKALRRSVTILHPAPVTDAQRALEVAESVFEDVISRRVVGGDYEERALETIRAALSAPVAQVDVEKLTERTVDVVSHFYDHEFQDDAAMVVRDTMDYLVSSGHLTPKTQESE